MELLVATRSAHKVMEIRRILRDVGVTVVDLDEAGIPWEASEEALEPFETFEENARSKARHFQRRSGLATVADDSGLEVDALDGAPGVRSKRFAPPGKYGDLAQDDANNRYLLERLRGIPTGQRLARFVCVAALDPGVEVQVFRGEVSGSIIEAPRGEGGFGYDPLFQDLTSEVTMAELSAAEKDERSHRGNAFRALASFLRQVGR